VHTLQTDSFVPELIQEGHMGQVHKKFSDGQVKELIERYLRKEIERAHVEQILGIRTRRFFSLIAGYKKDPEGFSESRGRVENWRPIRSRFCESRGFIELSNSSEIVRERTALACREKRI
jgi:hypothetical protein